MRLDEATRLFINNYPNPNTQRAYSSCLIPMQEFLGLARPVDTIKPPHLVEYAQHIAQRGLAQATINKIYKSIKTFFNWLIKLELIQTSPARVLKITRRSRYVDKDRAMSDYELNQILDLAKWDKRKYALVLFLADTGCRAGGASALRMDDVRLDLMEATVTEKGDKSRTVWYGDDCRDALRVWFLARKGDKGEYVFTSSGKKTTSAVISQIIRRLCDKAGIKGYGAHSLRHRKGHTMADAGVPATVVATVLGHENPQTTLDYYFPRDQARAAVAARSHAMRTDKARVRIIPFEEGKTGS